MMVKKMKKTDVYFLKGYDKGCSEQKKQILTLFKNYCKNCKKESIRYTRKGYYKNDCLLGYKHCTVKELRRQIEEKTK